VIDPTILRVASALLYEGYMLYPYRPSSVKNRHRFNFGVLHPAAWCAAHPGADAAEVFTEFLVRGDESAVLEARVRFLQLIDRTIGSVRPAVAALPEPAEYDVVDALMIGGRTWRPWQEAIERECVIPSVTVAELVEGTEVVFGFRAVERHEPLRDDDGRVGGIIVRRTETLSGRMVLTAEAVADGVWRARVRVENTATDAAEARRPDMLMHALISTHAILGVEGGTFVSLLDPPASLREAAAACGNAGLWPVLGGPEGRADTLLCSPIILYDHPAIAPESPNDLFDGTEIDEILSLRILTMTDEEKREMAETDERTRALLDRIESLSAEQLMDLHGTLREVRHAGELTP
jgi:hypothetical protein